MSTDSLRGAVKETIDGYFENVHTCLPAEIVLIAGGTVATVRPVLNKNYTDETFGPYPEIFNVPIRAMQTKLSGLSLDLTVGDQGALFFSERDFSDYKKLGVTNTPPTARKFSYNSCFFVPFLFTENVPDLHYKLLTTTLFRNDAGFINFANAVNSFGKLMQDHMTLLTELTTIGSPGYHTPDPVWIVRVLALQIQYAALHGTE